MNILAISAYYHESASCLLADGELVAAASEERFSRIKHDPSFPARAIRFCLRRGDLSIADLDAVAYYESPTKKLARQIYAASPSTRISDLPDPFRPERDIRELLGFEGSILQYEHHASHAASSFFFSGFADAAVLTVDGVGEWATTTSGRGKADTLEIFEETHFPHSLGLLYSTLTSYLGFRVNSAEYKVMGLAAYGRPTLIGKIQQLAQISEYGSCRLNMEYFDFGGSERMFTPRLCRLFDEPPRVAETEVSSFHADLACSLQRFLEEALLVKVRHLAERSESENLCMAGGVALNSVANGRILREGPFKRLFIQPAAGDAGACLGAAALAHVELTGKRHSMAELSHVYLGSSYQGSEVSRILDAVGVEASDFRGQEADLLEAVVDRLVQGDVIAWMHGRMEFGPRALGARSILADPRDPGIKDRINAMVKKREMFRPFAPSVLEAESAHHFDLDRPSPYMLRTCQVRSPIALAGVTHVDGSARPQTVDPQKAPRYARLLEAFHRRTGCPILLNTSFNIRGEPIVESPVDALRSLGWSAINALVLEDFLIDRQSIPEDWKQKPVFSQAVSSSVYTFV